jgi:hypothetical protein
VKFGAPMMGEYVNLFLAKAFQNCWSQSYRLFHIDQTDIEIAALHPFSRRDIAQFITNENVIFEPLLFIGS